MRILFIGCVESSYRLLKKLIEIKANVAGVITKEEAGQNSDYCDLRPLCAENDIPVCIVKNVNDSISMDFIKKCNPDIGFCFGWSQLLREEILEMFPQGVVGFHPASLPMNRGRHPIIWALVLGLDDTASSFFMLSQDADEGDVVSQIRVPILYEDDARSLYDKIMQTAEVQIEELVRAFENNRVSKTKQNIKSGNTWRKRNKADGEIDWRMSSRGIYNLVRALTRPYVGAHLIYDGNEYKVWKVQELEVTGLDNTEPGKVLAINPDGTIDIKTGENAVRLIDYDRFDVNVGSYVL